jgi:DNA-binding transcriptional ArsR family regulator
VPTSSTELDSLFLALGNSKRRELVLSLAKQPATVGQLAEAHHISLPAIHRHIRELEKAGLIQRKKLGRTNFVAFRRSGMKQAQAWLHQFHTSWGSDSETLENYINHLSK